MLLKLLKYFDGLFLLALEQANIHHVLALHVDHAARLKLVEIDEDREAFLAQLDATWNAG